MITAAEGGPRVIDDATPDRQFPEPRGSRILDGERDATPKTHTCYLGGGSRASVAGNDFGQKPRVVVHPSRTQGRSRVSKRPSTINVPDGAHGITRGLQHNTAHLIQSDIMQQGLQIVHITNVTCRAKTKLPDPDVGTLQEKSAADGAKPGEHVSKVALHTTSRKRCNGVRRPQMKSPRCLSQISQYAICSDVSSRTDMPNLPAFS